MNRFLKALFSLLIVATLVIFSFQPLKAESTSQYTYTIEQIISETTQHLDNDITLTIIITQENTSSSRMTSYTRSGSKYYIFRNSDGDELFRFTVTGVFTVTPDVGATCTSATYSTSITNDNWELESASAYASGNQAIGSATFIKKLLFITTDTASCDVTLTCDANGSLS